LALEISSALAKRIDPAAKTVRGQNGTIPAIVNALAKAGIELGENGSVVPRPKRKTASLTAGIMGNVVTLGNAPASQPSLADSIKAANKRLRQPVSLWAEHYSADQGI
jgi:hypothetical protein